MDNEKEIDDIIDLLDGLTADEVSRIKISVTDEIDPGESKKEYHHGRCDVGSPWARGCSFDVLNEEE